MCTSSAASWHTRSPGYVDPFVLHLFAALAEKERALISTRTRQALSAAKARGVSLGNPKLHVARKSAVEAVKTEADRYAANVLPIIREAQKAGANTLRQIAEALNARGIPTARGGQWYAQSVRTCFSARNHRPQKFWVPYDQPGPLERARPPRLQKSRLKAFRRRPTYGCTVRRKSAEMSLGISRRNTTAPEGRSGGTPRWGPLSGA
jgi:hypothetical protein